MNTVYKNALVYKDGAFKPLDITVSCGKVVSLEKRDTLLSSVSSFSLDAEAVDCSGLHIFPGFTDVHVHFREPGFIYKETVATGSRAAAHGGYTTVFTMPNLSPVPDSYENLLPQLEKIKSDAVIKVIPFGAITVGEQGKEIADLEGMAPYVCGFSDDGRGVQDRGMMREAMLSAKKLGKVISAHCEDNSLLHGGYIHDGVYAKANGHKGISSESEWRQIERDIALAAETGCKYHVCHISTKESVSLIRDAKKSGVDITCETGPHYLVLCDEDLKEDGRFKMNPPLRGRDDRDALIEGILDGTVDMIATDHAPHSAEEKSRGLKGSPFGITGIELAFPTLYTHLVKKGMISLEKLIPLLSEKPAERFGLRHGINVGEDAEFTAFDLEKSFTVSEDFFLSMGHSTPFMGETLFGVNRLTLFPKK